MDKKYYTIFKPELARKLLKLNNKLIDIKPMNGDPRRTIFIFEITDKFNSDMAELNKK